GDSAMGGAETQRPYIGLSTHPVPLHVGQACDCEDFAPLRLNMTERPVPPHMTHLRRLSCGVVRKTGCGLVACCITVRYWWRRNIASAIMNAAARMVRPMEVLVTRRRLSFIRRDSKPTEEAGTVMGHQAVRIFFRKARGERKERKGEEELNFSFRIEFLSLRSLRPLRSLRQASVL